MRALTSHTKTDRQNLDKDLAQFAHYREIYNTRARDYERIRSCRDYQNNILPTLNGIRPLAGLEVVESGAGSGHLTSILVPVVKSIRAFDIAQPLLDIAQAKLRQTGRQNWQVGAADHRHLPVDDQSADLMLAGYSLCHLVDENLATWRAEVDKAIAEMKRVLRPNGTIVLLESLGRGSDTPQPATHLIDYFQYLEEGLRFSSRRIRTDYRFESLAEVDSLVRDVFGAEVADKLLAEHSLVLTAWTAFLWFNL